MIAIGVIAIVALILIGLNIEKLVNNVDSTNKYLNDISNKLDNIIEHKKELNKDA